MLEQEHVEIINKISKTLSRFQEIDLGYVHGSFLKNTFRDIDVAVYVSKSFEPYERFKFAMRVGRELEKALEHRYEFDVRLLNDASLSYQYEAIKGYAVFSRDEAMRINYETQVLSEYLDYKDTSDWLDLAFLAGI